MIPTAWQSKRLLVPRWRSLGATLASQELATPRRRPAKGHAVATPHAGSDYLTRLERWNLAPSLVSAAEFVEAAIIEGRERDAVPAARRLLNVDRDAAPLIREQAASLLARAGHAAEVPADARLLRPASTSARGLTRLHPRDPLAWVELALQQTIGSHAKAAQRSMAVALELAPNNRHVLRSAARLHLHLRDPQRAHEIIARNEATRFDPWLIAAEIAFAELAERPSRFAKTGKHMLGELTFLPRHLTELAGSVATLELANGNRRGSRKTFVQSLMDPTGSALAQGEWVTPFLGADLVPLGRLGTTPEASEALAFHLYRVGKYSEVADACETWAISDPFSIRPYEFGAATAGIIEDYARAVEFAMRGLQLRPHSPELINSAAFALASLDRTADATDILRQLRDPLAPRFRHIAEANRGLIAFREGDLQGGRDRYRRAAEGFAREGFPQLSARAQIYLAREAALAECSDAPELLARAQKAMKPYLSTDSALTLRSLEKRLLGHAVSPDLTPENAQPAVPQVTVTVIHPSGEERKFLLDG